MNEKQIEILKSRLTEYVEMVTEPSRGHNMYICPICGSGTGKNHSGAFSIKQETNTWKCFSCDNGGDIFDLIGKVEKIDDFKQRLRRAGEIFKVSLDEPVNNATYKPKIKIEEIENYQGFFKEAHDHINKTSYHRGLSDEIINKFNIGFVENWKHPKNLNAPASPRLIIPLGSSSYSARDTRENVESAKYMKVGKAGLFNINDLWGDKKPVFITEGELDALSIIDCGGAAVGLGSLSNIGALTNLLSKNNFDKFYMLMLDNDEKGKEGTAKLKEELNKLNLEYYQINFNEYAGFKDANEMLMKNKNVLIEIVQNAEIIEKDLKEYQKQEYEKTALSNYIDTFLEDIMQSEYDKCISTGFDKLDKELDGGLYGGLYILGAIPSLGKSTLSVQIADQIAKNGQDVLLIELEMARTEIMAKSISRLTAEEVLRTGGKMQNAKTSRGITAYKRYEHYNQEEQALIITAVKQYKEFASHLFIYEGVGDIGVKEVFEKAEQHKEFTGRAPVVIVDYLQILTPYNEKWGDKQNIDKAVLTLKQLARQENIPVIVISSFNRSNYKEKASMESFKESGAIEYGCDVLLALDFENVGNKDFDVNVEKKKEKRDVELKILKNRFGRTGERIKFDYYPKFNYFKEK